MIARINDVGDVIVHIVAITGALVERINLLNHPANVIGQVIPDIGIIIGYAEQIVQLIIQLSDAAQVIGQAVNLAINVITQINMPPVAVANL